MYAAGNLCAHRASVTSVVTAQIDGRASLYLPTKTSSSSSSSSVLLSPENIPFKLISGSRDHSIIIWGDLPPEALNDEKNSSSIDRKLSKRSRRRLAQAKAESGSATSSNATVASSSAPSSTADSPLAVPLRKLDGHSGFISSLALSFDCRFLLSASWDKTVRLWNLQHPEQQMKLKQQQQVLSSSSQNNNSNNNNNNNNKRIPEFGACLAKCIGHTKDVLSCCFDMKQIPSKKTTSKEISKGEKETQNEIELCLLLALSSSRDGTVRLWSLGTYNPVTGELVGPTPQNGTNAVCLRVFGGADDTKLSISSSSNNSTMDWISSVGSLHTTDMVNDISFMSGGWDGCLRKWYVKLDELMMSNNNNEKNSSSLSTSPLIDTAFAAEHRLSSSLSSSPPSSSKNKITKNNNNQQLLQASAITSLIVSPDSSLVTCAFKDGYIHLWETAFQQPTGKFSENHILHVELGKEQVHNICYAPTRYWIACACDSAVRIVDLETKRVIVECSNPHEMQYVKSPPVPTCCAFASDAETLYVGYSDNIVRAFCLNQKLS